MDRKAEVGVGIMLIAAITIIAGLALYQAIDQNVGNAVTTVSIVNHTFTAAAVGSDYEWPGCQAYEGTPEFSNRSTAAYKTFTSNFTVTNGVRTDGVMGVLIKTKADSLLGGQPVNATFVCQPDGYISNSGARTMTLLIVLFAALAVAFVALVPTLRSGILSMMD